MARNVRGRQIAAAPRTAAPPRAAVAGDEAAAGKTPGRHNSLVAKAYEEIKEKIITLYFLPGQYLNEASISALLQVGRTPVHQALQRLEQLPVAVRTLPALEDLASGRIAVGDLRDIDPQDLLGREPVPANAELLARNIKGKSVLVTGAGGSIGSELVRAVLRQKPRRLILLDPVGTGGLFGIGKKAAPPPEEMTTRLLSLGLRAARFLAEVDGIRYFEAVKRREA